MEEAQEGILESRWLLTVVMGCFGALALWKLGLFRHDYDEGQYIALGQAIASGEVPFRDFFYHQPAYYLYLLSWLPEPTAQSIWLYRLPGLIGIWVTGGVLYFIAKDGLNLRLAILAPVVFYACLLLAPGVQALPHGLMILGTALGFYLILVRGGRLHIIVGATLMAVAVCLKPLAISAVIAMAFTLLILPENRKHFILYLLTVALVGTLGILGMHLLSDGGFTHALTLQLSRTSSQSGVQIMKSLPGLSADMDTLGEVSSILFNVAGHGIALTQLPLDFPGNYVFANSTLQLLVLALIGLWGLRTVGRETPWFTALGLWWLMAAVFIFLVWSPSWQDYFIQYVSPMALLAARCLDRFCGGESLRPLRYGVTLYIVSIAILVQMASFSNGMAQEAAEVEKIKANTQGDMAWLTFDPYLRFKTGSEEACELRDPLNVFGMPTELPGLDIFESKRRTMADIISCLENAERTGIWVDDESLMYIDESLARYLSCQDKHLVIYHKPDHARRLRERLGLKVISGKLCEDHW